MDAAFFAYSWRLPAYSGAFLLTVDDFSFFAYSWSFLLTVSAFLLTVGAFFAYSGKVPPIRALRDCKQRSLSVSKKAPTVSKASPIKNPLETAPRSCRFLSLVVVKRVKRVLQGKPPKVLPFSESSLGSARSVPLEGAIFNRVQTRCIVKGEAQKSPLF